MLSIHGIQPLNLVVCSLFPFGEYVFGRKPRHGFHA